MGGARTGSGQGGPVGWMAGAAQKGGRSGAGAPARRLAKPARRSAAVVQRRWVGWLHGSCSGRWCGRCSRRMARCDSSALQVASFAWAGCSVMGRPSTSVMGRRSTSVRCWPSTSAGQASALLRVVGTSVACPLSAWHSLSLGSDTRTSDSKAFNGAVVRTRPVGSVHVAVPSAASRSRQPGRCLMRWCRRQSDSRLRAAVRPIGQGRTWSRSQNRAATEQPGKRQRPSRPRTSAASSSPGR